MQDPHVPLWITEGCKKADALVSHGACALDIGGVWSWIGSNAQGGKSIALPDFATSFGLAAPSAWCLIPIL